MACKTSLGHSEKERQGAATLDIGWRWKRKQLWHRSWRRPLGRKRHTYKASAIASQAILHRLWAMHLKCERPEVWSQELTYLRELERPLSSPFRSEKLQTGYIQRMIAHMVDSIVTAS